MNERETLQDVVCPTRARLEMIRREAIAEGQAEVARMLHEARHLPKDGLHVKEVQVAEVEDHQAEAPVFEVVEEGGAVVAEFTSKGVADLDALERTQEFGIPFKVRRKRVKP